MNCARTVAEFQSFTTVPNSTGAPVKTWSKLASSYVEMLAVRGREDTTSAQGDRQAPVETWLLTMPYLASLVGITDHRAVIDGVNYNIRSSMDRDRRRRTITMEIERGVAI